MREAGSSTSSRSNRGTVGRPSTCTTPRQRRLTPRFRSTGACRARAGSVAAMDVATGGDDTDAEETGRAWAARHAADPGGTASRCHQQLPGIGFDPAVEPAATGRGSRFVQCPPRPRRGLPPSGVQPCTAGSAPSPDRGGREAMPTLLPLKARPPRPRGRGVDSPPRTANQHTRTTAGTDIDL